MVEVRDIYLGASSLITALGDKSATLEAMDSGMSGLHYDERFGMMTGVVSGIVATQQATRFEVMVMSQIESVVAESHINLSGADTQIIISTTKGNVELLARAEGQILPEGAFLHHTAMRVAERFGCRNRPIVISNACISGVTAFVVARRMLTDGERRHALIVGCDVLSEFITTGFASFKSVSPRPCRPYDAERDGLTLGEACGAVMLTIDERFAAHPLVRLTGGAVTNDANHISGPSRTGDGLCYAIEAAMKEAGVEASQIGFVNTHGTATLYNDEMESKALALAGLEHAPLNGLKGYIGHTLGASGVVETILCVEELRRGVAFGTFGYAQRGTSVALSVSAESQSIVVRRCVKTASGFGGCNAAIVLDAAMSDVSPTRMAAKHNTKVAGEYRIEQSKLPFGEFIRAQYKALGMPNMKFFKMSDLCKAVYIAAENLLQGVDLKAYATTRRAIILSNSVSSLEADMDHQRIVNQRMPEGASPAVFVYTLPNVAAGEVCIRHRFQGDNTFFIEDADSGLAETYARALIADGRADLVLCGWCDKLGERWNVNLKLLKIE